MSTAPTGEDAGFGLVGDVGATNARFRLVNPQHEWASDLLVLPATGFNEGTDLLHAAHAHFNSPALAQCVLAVAGPVSLTARHSSDQYWFVFRAGVGANGHRRFPYFLQRLFRSGPVGAVSQGTGADG